MLLNGLCRSQPLTGRQHDLLKNTGAVSARWQCWFRIKSWTVLRNSIFFLAYQNNLASHPGLELPPGTGSSPLKQASGSRMVLLRPAWECRVCNLLPEFLALTIKFQSYRVIFTEASVLLMFQHPILIQVEGHVQAREKVHRP